MFGLDPDWEDWELRCYPDWRGLELKLNRKVCVGEFLIHEIRKEKEGMQPKYRLNVRDKTIQVFEFHLKEPLYDLIPKLDGALQLVGNHAEIGIDMVYITPRKIWGQYPTAGAHRRERLVYFTLSYLLLLEPELSLHVWHENLHLLLPEQRRVDNSEEFVVKKLSGIFGQTVMGSGWNPENNLASGWTDELKWNKKTVKGLLETLEGRIEEDILGRFDIP